METIIKKTILVEYESNKYSIPDDATFETILMQLGLAKDTPVRMTWTKNGFLITQKI